MNCKSFLAQIVALAIFGTFICSEGQAQSSRPDLSGKWTLIEGKTGGNSPLGNEGSITQDATALTFQVLKVPFDGTTTTKEDGAYVWNYEGRWVGHAFVVSMKASSGGTPGNFTDLMIVSREAGDTMTMVLMRTTLTGNMQTYTLKYRKS